MKRIGSALVACFIGLLSPRPASATLIVDTGAGPGGQPGGWCVGGPQSCNNGAIQWLAAEFVLSSSETLTDVRGWMRTWTGSPNVQIAIYSDGGDVPAAGPPVYISSSFIPGVTAGWYGASGLNWNLSAGEWWIAFQSNDNLAVMPSPSIHPLANEAFSLNGGGWGPADGIALGVQIEAVPEPASLLLLGGGLVGLASRRRRPRS